MGQKQSVVPPPHHSGFQSIVPQQDGDSSQSLSSEAMDVQSSDAPVSPSNKQLGKEKHKESDKKGASKSGFDFRLTEGQSRRNAMADSEMESSVILDFLHVAGHKVAESYDKVQEHKITRVVNCSAAIVPSYFEHLDDMTYLTLNMVDGRQDDITWFLPQVISFIEEGRQMGKKTLIHCEKGISRSCSFAIAYLMWSTGRSWQQAFDFVKAQRPVCSPNTGFTCNLIELGDLLGGETSRHTKVFRLAFHLPHDPATAVFKLCRDIHTRKMLPARRSLLNSRGVFLILSGSSGLVDQPRGQEGELVLRPLGIVGYLWCGTDASEESRTLGAGLAHMYKGIFTAAQGETVMEGREPEAFWKLVERDSDPAGDYADLYDFRGAPTVIPDATTHPTYATSNTASSSSTEPVGVPMSITPAPMISLNLSEPPKATGVGRSSSGSTTAAPADTASSSAQEAPKEGLNIALALAMDNIINEESPSIRERHPEKVDVLRGPTPVEDLDPSQVRRPAVTTGSSTGAIEKVAGSSHAPAFFVRDAGTGVSQQSQGSTTTTVATTISSADRSQSIMSDASGLSLGDDIPRRPEKPLLYQAEDTEGDGQGISWVAMGVYDDGDLVEDGTFLLVCPEKPDYLWVGPEFKIGGAHATTISTTQEAFHHSDILPAELSASVRAWASTIARGQVSFDGITEKALLKSDLHIVTQGSEPEEFWDIFSEGF